MNHGQSGKVAKADPTRRNARWIATTSALLGIAFLALGWERPAGSLQDLGPGEVITREPLGKANWKWLAAGAAMLLLSFSLRGSKPDEAERQREAEEEERRADSWRLRTGLRLQKHRADLRERAEARRMRRMLRRGFFARFKEPEEEREEEKILEDKKQKELLLKRQFERGVTR